MDCGSLICQCWDILEMNLLGKMVEIGDGLPIESAESKSLIRMIYELRFLPRS